MEISKQISTQIKSPPPVDQLGFGIHFSNHMLVCSYKNKQWEPARIEPLKDFSLHPAASVLHYAQCLFEGMKAFRQENGRIVLFRPEFNYDRFVRSAERLCMPAPSKELFLEGVNQLVQLDQDWVPQSQTASLYIRPTLIANEAFLGVRPAQEVMFFIILSPVGSYYGTGSDPIKIWVEENYQRAAGRGGLGAVKAGANYAASIKAAKEARERGYAQVLWLDDDREGIEEVGTMNIFFVFKDEVVTPALNDSILAGGVRDSAIQLLKHKGYNCVERRITLTELQERLQKGELLESFGTGTAAMISSVGLLSVHGKDWVINNNQSGPVAKDLFEELHGIQRGTRKDIFGWIRPVFPE